MMISCALRPDKLTKTQKKETVEKLFEESSPCFDFFLMLVLSTVIITLGLLRSIIAVKLCKLLLAAGLSLA